MKKVEVDAALLKLLVENFRTGDRITAIQKPLVYIDLTPEIDKAYDKLEEAVSYAFPLGGEMQIGYCVIPKPGSNYLRSGHTAYGEAVVVSLDPFTVYSLDGKLSWVGALKDTLVVRSKMDEDEFKKILAIHNKPFEQLVEEVSEFCKTQVPIN